MFGLDRHVSTQCVDYKTYLCACSHTKSRVSAHFLSYEVISMRNVKHMTPCWSPNFLLTSRNDVQPHDLTYEPFSVCNFSHTKDMSENSGLTHAKDCGACSLWKKSLCATFWLTWTCPHANFLIRGRVCIQPVPQFHTFGLDRHVFHAVCRIQDVFMRVFTHTKRPVSAHFVSYEVISTRNVKHMTPFSSPNFP